MKEQTDLRHDVDVVLSQLPAHDRLIALSLAEHTVAEVTRRTGLSRQQVRTVRARVRRQFEVSGVAA